MTPDIKTRLNDFAAAGDDYEDVVRKLCEYAARDPYEYFNIPVDSRPRRRALNTIHIGQSRDYLIPSIVQDEFINSVHSYGRTHKTRYRITWLKEYLTVQTATVTRIA